MTASACRQIGGPLFPLAGGRRAAARGAAAALCLALLGCQALGPATLAAGRGAYNDVIARTSAEQTLGLVVRMRYSDPVGLLTVSSVTANLQFALSAKSEIGIGPESHYNGNLVPLTAGVGYEDNPTISYTPIEGQAFLREWLAPLSLVSLVSVMQEARHSSAFVPLLVERMNHLRSGPDASDDERDGFLHVAATLGELHRRGIATWSGEKGPPERYELTLSGYAPDAQAEVEDLLQRLDVRGDTRSGAPIHIPIELGAPDGTRASLRLDTRSVAGIMRTVADLIEVPEKDVAAGVVTPNESPSAAGDLALRIRSSDGYPSHANLAVSHRGSWFYLDDTDLASKAIFQGVQTLFQSRLADATRAGAGTPVLTLPVR